MQINQNVKGLLNKVNENICYITGSSFNTNFFTPNGKCYPLANDYCFWIYNGIIEDYQAIIFLISNLNNIYSTSLRPIYSVLRGTIEKYADVLNFSIYKDKYYSYISYLNFDSIGDKNSSLAYWEETKKLFNLRICNRKTRYYLLGQVNSIIDEQFTKIIDFNRKLSEIDSYYSMMLHNNLDSQKIPNEQRIVDILTYLQYILYTATLSVNNHYKDLLDLTVISTTLFNIQELTNALNYNIYTHSY